MNPSSPSHKLGAAASATPRSSLLVRLIVAALAAFVLASCAADRDAGTDTAQPAAQATTTPGPGTAHPAAQATTTPRPDALVLPAFEADLGDAGAPRPPPTASQARVLRVIDGDTVVLSDIGVGARDNQTGGHRARLIGIDTPEVHGGTECYGREASSFAKRILDGQDVFVDFDVAPTDRYGRALVYIWTLDGDFFNARLVAEGYAVQSTYPPNVRYADLFGRFARDAREASRGLWSACPLDAGAPPPAAPPGEATSSGSLEITFTEMTSPVARRGRATATVATTPGARCTITVTYRSGPSRAQGLAPTTASASGEASWTWNVGSNTTPGDWPVEVGCTHGGDHGSARTTFTVVA